MDANTRLLFRAIVPCLPVNHKTAGTFNTADNRLSRKPGGFVTLRWAQAVGPGNSQVNRNFLPAGKKSEKNQKTLLTPKGASPYKPVINEGGAPLAQTNSPL